MIFKFGIFAKLGGSVNKNGACIVKRISLATPPNLENVKPDLYQKNRTSKSSVNIEAGENYFSCFEAFQGSGLIKPCFPSALSPTQKHQRVTQHTFVSLWL